LFSAFKHVHVRTRYHRYVSQLLIAVLALASAFAPVRVEAQDDARLEVALPARAISRSDGPSFAPKAILATRELRELLTSGFPARLHFRCELWRNDRLNNAIDAAVEWDVVVRFDQLSKKFEVFRIVGDRVTKLGQAETIDAAQAFVEQPFRILSPPMRRGRSYYYDSSMDIEVLSLSDLDEVERWLRGDVRPALSGDRNPGTAVTRTLRGFFVRLLGGERRHYQTRTPTFIAE
jgi:hypothetical protein